MLVFFQGWSRLHKFKCMYKEISHYCLRITEDLKLSLYVQYYKTIPSAFPWEFPVIIFAGALFWIGVEVCLGLGNESVNNIQK